jgi:hypothetical protein
MRRKAQTLASSRRCLRIVTHPIRGVTVQRKRNPIKALALATAALIALASPSVAATGTGAAHHRWANYDNDTWGGSSDASNPGFATNPQGCDPIDPAQCMLPYPNDWFTRSDPTSATGRRLDLNALAMPRNILGKPIDPSDYNQSDGFSAGATLLTVVPGMTKSSDLASSRLPTDLNMAANSSPDLGVILLDTTTGRTWPVWAEIDQYTAEAGVLPARTVQQDIMIHPAANLLDGHRYIVALRDLHTDNGSLAAPSPAFESYVSAYLHPPASSADPRAAHMDRVFEDLREAGWTVTSRSSDLYLAWDFTTASTQNVTGRLLAIRDDAFGQLGETKAQIDAGRDAGAAPAFTVSSVTDFSASQNPNVAREISGSFTVPCYIAPTCSPPIKCDQLSSQSPFDDCPSPGAFYYTDPINPDDTPSQVPGQTYQAAYICVVGRAAFDARRLLRPVDYGHGLFGSYTEVTASPQEEMANREGMMYCATDWFGWANSDIPNALLGLADLSNFKFLTDRGQQGELDFLYLQRLMINPGGFASDSAFQYSPGDSFINLDDGVYYDGNSQGGIFGGTVCAVSIDVPRCALGVNGIDYSTLLPRSVDYVATDTLTQFVAAQLEQFASNPASYNPTDLTGVGYSNVFDLFYPDQSQRQLILDIIQTLWDRADPDGYASHMTASAEGGLLPDCTGMGVVKASAQTTSHCDEGTTTPGPDRRVLMQVAWGDHQVANFTAFDEARTIGAEAVGGPATSNVLGGGEALLATRLCNTDAHGLYTSNDPVDGKYCYAADSPLWHIAPIGRYPYDGSAIVIFDGGPDGVSGHLGGSTVTGTDPPPPSDVPPPDTATNGDPHEYPRRACAAQDQKGAFFNIDGFVTAPLQLLDSGGTLPGPPYFSGGWHGTCSLA